MPPTAVSQKFKVTTDVAGHASLQVDGEEVPDVAGLNLLVQPGEVTQLHVVLRGGVDVEGEAMVTMGQQAHAADLVRRLDPVMVERRALALTGYGTTPLTHLMVQAVALILAEAES